jgi:hypothetical protein
VTWAVILLLAHITTPGQGGCPNLSGRYVLAGADGHVIIVIAQTRCASIKIDWTVQSPPNTYRTVHQLVLDGRDQPDTAWFRATGYQITAAKFNGRILELTGKSIAESDTGVFMWTGRVASHAGGDLCVGFQVQPAKVWGNVAARVEGGEAAAEQRAASRSAKPCPAR